MASAAEEDQERGGWMSLRYGYVGLVQIRCCGLRKVETVIVENNWPTSAKAEKMVVK